MQDLIALMIVAVLVAACGADSSGSDAIVPQSAITRAPNPVVTQLATPSPAAATTPPRSGSLIPTTAPATTTTYRPAAPDGPQDLGGDDPGTASVASRWERFLPSICVLDIEISPDGVLWAACDTSGVFVFQDGEWIEFEMPPDRPGREGVETADAFYDLAFAGDGTLVAAASYGEEEGPIWLLMTLRDGEWNVTALPARGTAGPATLATGPDGSVWAATTESLRRYRNGGWRTIDERNATNVAVDPDGTVWYATDVGLGEDTEEESGSSSSGTLFRWSGSSELMAEEVYDVWAGPDGTLWVYADVVPEGCGVTEYYCRYSTLHRLVEGELVLDELFLDQVEPTKPDDMAFGPDGQIWAVSDGSGIHYFDGTAWDSAGTSWPAITASAPDEWESTNTVALGADGTVWFGTASGILHYHPPSE